MALAKPGMCPNATVNLSRGDCFEQQYNACAKSAVSRVLFDAAFVRFQHVYPRSLTTFVSEQAVKVWRIAGVCLSPASNSHVVSYAFMWLHMSYGQKVFI